VKRAILNQNSGDRPESFINAAFDDAAARGGFGISLEIHDLALQVEDFD
jgi:hypothetical protein